MASNPYVNKVQKADGTVIMDISDTTASEGDVVSGKSFYKASGAKGTGTLDSKAASSGGTDLSLVTTGEKYTWNNKAGTSTATQSANGLMSSTDKTKLDGIASGATANTGTITGITMNGVSKGTSGVVNLGTVITSHQSIYGKADKVADATSGHIAKLDSNGNLVDGGKSIDNVFSHGHTGTVSAGTNLNSFSTPGSYLVPASDVTNEPSVTYSNGRLDVIKLNHQYTRQIWTEFGGTGENVYNNTWYREIDTINSSQTPWRKLPSKNLTWNDL